MKRVEQDAVGTAGTASTGEAVIQRMSTGPDKITETAVSEPLELHLRVDDLETLHALSQCEGDEELQRFALAALKFGSRILREASGAIDRDTIRKEGSGIVEQLQKVMQEGSRDSLQSVSEEFRRFLDPESGILQQRLERLVAGDGSELNQVMSRHLEKESQLLGQLLEQHVGESSELLKILSPDQKDGLISQFQGQFQTTLGEQSQHILEQFSLDQKDSALNRLVKSITDSNGTLKAELSGDVDRMKAEFSLDNKESALSRIVEHLQKNEESISHNLTLDREDSPMARMRREFIDILEKESDKNQSFRAEVLTHLEAKNVRKDEASRSTHQGWTFEDQVNDHIERKSQEKGEYFEATGMSTGRKGSKKVGDGVITLGPDTRAPEARIVIEAKKAKNYTLKKALDELESARENREAQAGIFVFAVDSAPKNVQPVECYGCDVVVMWDPEDETTDAYLYAGITIARSIVIKEMNRDDSEIDIVGLEQAVRDIEAQATEIDKIITKARSVEKAGKDIGKSADNIRGRLFDQAQQLDDLIDPLRDGD